MSIDNKRDVTEELERSAPEYVKEVATITLPDVPLDELPRGFWPGDKLTVIRFVPKGVGQ